MNSTETLIHNTATVAFVLGRDDLSVSNLRERYTEFSLPALLDGLLADLEDAVRELGKYDVPLLINAENVARLMQLEIGSEVEVRTETTRRGDAQYLVMKQL